MRVHHLNCATMAPPLTPKIVAHCLLVEAPHGLVLVDTGFGVKDCAEPSRLGLGRFVISPVLDRAETAYEQVRALGFRPEDVRDVVLTHADLDHAGGAADFPWANVHLTSAEVDAWNSPRSLIPQQRHRYRPAHRKDVATVVRHDIDGEPWHGFAAARPILDGVVMVSMPGHTKGHAAIAVDAGDYWILHAGDAFFDRRQLSGGIPTPAFVATETAMMVNPRQVRANHARLKELWHSPDDTVRIINAHDSELLRRARTWTSR
jgi:glyoxylase-like metal-dependent hydrolase (beta-lactamase superfamily II)